METVDYWAVFLSAFLASTLLPGGSEAVLGYLAALATEDEVAAIISLATIGNTLGGMTSWGIGVLLARRFPGESLKAHHRKAVDRIRRSGKGALLFSWVPIVGDPLCVAAGWLRIHWAWALVLIGSGKMARYVALVCLVRTS